MRRSAYRRAAEPTGGNRRLLAVGAVIAAMGAAVAFTTISSAGERDRPPGSGAGKVVNGQTILTDTCVDSDLEAHNGFQLGNRCISTQFGEVASAGNGASLLITEAPREVAPNTPFTLRVSTRNLIRDRFLAAGQGGYYVESSVLQNGLTRGHFHTACRMLGSTRVAPDPAPVPAFFVATEDNGGQARPDTVTIQVPGLPSEGTAQCASWAGDGSHRIPMMERANQTPALDAVRINVRARNNDGQNNNNGGQNNGGGDGNNNDGQNNGGDSPDATVAPTAPSQGGNATKPSARDTAKPTATAKPATTVRPATTVKPATTSKPAAPRTARSESDDELVAPEDATPAQTRAAKPKATVKALEEEPAEDSAEVDEATDITYSNDDGQPNSGTKAPSVEEVAAQSTEKQGGLLALTGGNSMAVIGVAVVLMLGGFTIMALTRRRRPGSTWQ